MTRRQSWREREAFSNCLCEDSEANYSSKPNLSFGCMWWSSANIVVIFFSFSPNVEVKNTLGTVELSEWNPLEQLTVDMLLGIWASTIETPACVYTFTVNTL